MALQPFGLWPFFLIPFFAPTGAWGIHRKTSTYTGQHKHRINVHIHINIHALSRIRTYDPDIKASQNSSYLRPLGYRDLLVALQFLNPIHSQQDSFDGGSARRKAATFTQNNTNTSMPRVGF
jgi:hypothetical protein